MKKRLISLLLTLSMVFSMVPMLGISSSAGGLSVSDEQLAAWGKDIFMAYYLTKDDSDQFSVNYYALDLNNNDRSWCLRQRDAALDSSKYEQALAYEFLTDANLEGVVDWLEQELIEKKAYYLTHFFNAWLSNKNGQLNTEIDAKDKTLEYKKNVIDNVEDITDFSGTVADYINKSLDIAFGEESKVVEEIGIGLDGINCAAEVLKDYNEFTETLAYFSSVNGSEKSFATILNMLLTYYTSPNGLPSHADEALQQILDTYDYTVEGFSDEELINSLSNTTQVKFLLDIADLGIEQVFDAIDDVMKKTKSGPLFTIYAIKEAQECGEFINNNLFGTDKYVEHLFNIINLGDIVLCLQSLLNYLKDEYIADPTNDEKARLVNTAYKMTLSFIYYTYDHCANYLEAAYRTDMIAWLQAWFGNDDLNAQLEDLRREQRAVGAVLFNYEKQISDKYRAVIEDIVLENTKYAITYDANGGINAPAKQIKKHDESITITTSEPTCSGYTFMGWSLYQNSSKVNMNPGDKYSDNSNVTLYAVWKSNTSSTPTPVTYTVSFSANAPSGTVSNLPSALTKTAGASVTIPSKEPTRDGYEFIGWSTSSTATIADSAYASGKTYSTDSNLVLYAVWEQESLDGTGIAGDINADKSVDNKDLLAYRNYLDSKAIARAATIDVNALDVNGNGIAGEEADFTRLFQFLTNWDVPIYYGEVTEEDVTFTVEHIADVTTDILAKKNIEVINGEAYMTWTINSSHDWTVESSANWCEFRSTGTTSASGSAGTTKLILDITSQTQTSREAVITFTVNGETYTATVYQQKATFSITHPEQGDVILNQPIELYNNANISMNWTITSSHDWNAVIMEGSGDWFEIEKTSDTNLKITTTDYASGGETNTGGIQFYVNGDYYSIEIYQTAETEEEPDALDAPTNLKASVVDSDTIKLTWDSVDGADGYYVYRTTYKNGSMNQVKKITSGSTTSWTNNNLTPETTYYYIVTAYAGDIQSEESNIASATTDADEITVSAPENVDAELRSDDSIRVSWDKVTEADGYIVYRKASTESKYSVVLETSNPDLTYCNDSAVNIGETYSYYVIAYAEIDGSTYNSEASDIVTIATGTTLGTPAVVLRLGKTELEDGYTHGDSYTGGDICYLEAKVTNTHHFYRSFEGDASQNKVWDNGTFTNGEYVPVWVNISDDIASGTYKIEVRASNSSVNNDDNAKIATVCMYIKVKNDSYDPVKALEYAIKYNGAHPNSSYNTAYNKNTSDNDCANFVSQCLEAGGLNQTDEWYFDGSDSSSTWLICRYSSSGKKGLMDYLASLGYKVYGYDNFTKDVNNPTETYPTELAKIKPGDIIFSKGTTNGINHISGHVMIVERVDYSTGWVYFHGHSNDRCGCTSCNDAIYWTGIQSHVAMQEQQ